MRDIIVIGASTGGIEALKLHCVPLGEIAGLLVRLRHATGEVKGGQPVSEAMETEVKVASEDNAIESGILNWGEPSLFACPECHGVSMQLKEENTYEIRSARSRVVTHRPPRRALIPGLPCSGASEIL